METSTAKSDKDKAKEGRERSVDIPKTRRRIEDTLRKSCPETIIQIAEMLGVKLAEQVPEKLEIILADVWEELDKISSYVWTLPNATEIQAHMTLGHLQNTIFDSLPPRFNTYFLISTYEQTCWSRMSRDFFTKEAAEKHRKPGETIRVNHFNVTQMRITIKYIRKQIQDRGIEGTPSLEPDEEERLKYFQKILYRSFEKTNRESQTGEQM